MITPGSEPIRSETAVGNTVCLVDDDAAVRTSVGRLLESAGYTVHSFAEPEGLLNHLARHRAAVVIADIWLGKMNGMELLAHLCARSPDTPVIFITGHEDGAAERTVMQGGAFAFFLKPVDDERFLNSVRSAVNRTLGAGDKSSERFEISQT